MGITQGIDAKVDPNGRLFELIEFIAYSVFHVKRISHDTKSNPSSFPHHYIKLSGAPLCWEFDYMLGKIPNPPRTGKARLNIDRCINVTLFY